MAFEARPLRVQLPCKSITLNVAEEHDAELQAHRYWRTIAVAHGGFGLPEGRCEECSGHPSEPLCENGSEELNIHAILDVRVLPILRRQLEARLREIEEAERAITRASGGG